jgi:hypothetical protein
MPRQAALRRLKDLVTGVIGWLLQKAPDSKQHFLPSCRLAVLPSCRLYPYSPARSRSIASWDALWPGAPMTQPPGQAPEPQRKSPETGPWYD